MILSIEEYFKHNKQALYNCHITQTVKQKHIAQLKQN